MRQRLTVLLASLGLAVGGLAVTAGPASAESYGYINWTNNCGGPWFYGIIYASGTKSGTSVVQEPSVPAGETRSRRVQSGYQYHVTANGGWITVAINDIPGRVHTVPVRAC
ncbi:hypothetical protein AB0H12_05130 [Actinosynnema sp. NPDC023794]